MFFRRNAHLDLSTSQCEFNGQCDVNTHSRKSCRFCRMKKCLDVGMKKDLFRPARSKPHSQRQHFNDIVEWRNKVPVSLTVQPLDLLHNDRSLLSTDQWSLLSNVVHCYDALSPIPEIQLTMASFATAPPKHRLKLATNNLMATMNAFFSSVWSFVAAVPHFTTLPLIIRQNLIRRNVHHMGALNGAHICQEGSFHDDPFNRSVAFAEYGEPQMLLMLRAIELGILDRTISKLFLLVMSFSTASDMVQPSSNDKNLWKCDSICFNTNQTLAVQNIFVEVMFKYMIHRFGYIQASAYFAELIKNAMIQGAYLQQAEQNSNHNDMIQNIVQRFEQSLISYQQPRNVLSSVIF
ncbi:unnamed protein product [Rotaria magnacalcarata]|uniref:Nuclear receptor domain-containing protein n=1 Tax=Rotaria magnacalcarata TaxID=392030 RepID=A0A816GNC2_9BILA|nr:unnamed protein product [Rotaria magnacalcarata]CAF1675612.1 unnamed protein product [Rotaria magnacalcarata]CAF2262393.1 unnamed protein product [Rotaria magnacalcarata]